MINDRNILPQEKQVGIKDNQSDIPTPKNPLIVNQGEVEKWIGEEPDERFKQIKKKLIDNLQCVPHEIFQQNLDRCINQLNDLLGDKVYAVLWDYKPHASKRWVYELARSNLKNPPVQETYFGSYDEMEDYKEFRKIIDSGVDTFVVMDDAIYSGEQFIRSCLKHLFYIYKKFGYYPARLPKVYLVSPYMTNSFKNKINIQTAQQQGLVYLITEKIMPTLEEILTPQEMKILEERNLELDSKEQKKPRGMMDVNYDNIYYGATLTAFDHRVADAHSFCEPLAFRLGLSAPKPYADSSTAYYQKEEKEFQAYQQPKLKKQS